MLVLLYGLFIFGSAIYFFLTWNNKHWEKRGLPFVEPNLFSGNFPSLLTQKRNIAYDYEDLYNKFKGKFSVAGIFSMRQPQYFITDADVAKDILISKFKNFHDNEFADMIDKKKDPIFGNNPFMLKGQEWKEKRAEITPAFTQLRLKAMYPVIDDVGNRLKKFLLREKHQAIDARDLAENFTTDVVSSCIFGADAGALSGNKSPIKEMGKNILGFTPKIIIYFILSQVIPSLKKYVKIGFVPKHVEEFFVKLTKDAIVLRNKSSTIRDDYLTYLLELRAKKNLSDTQMTSHAISFFTDGFITSSVVLAFALYELARSKDAQYKLRKEIRETIEKHGQITFELVQDMPYLEQVMSENLRLNPPLAFITKVCTESCELPLTENKMVPVEKGYNVILPMRSIQRDPRYFEKPEEFIPERFAPEKGGTKIYKDKGAFLAFGDGPRICLGMRFAQTQIKVAIAAIVQNFEVTLDPRTAINPVLHPKEVIPTIIGGIWLRFKELKE
uniref:Putative cytochrome n=1 Tax=Nyssomyia neivai TaxID=330878 RepID=A0A1L8E4B8_9DIPT